MDNNNNTLLDLMAPNGPYISKGLSTEATNVGSESKDSMSYTLDCLSLAESVDKLRGISPCQQQSSIEYGAYSDPVHSRQSTPGTPASGLSSPVACSPAWSHCSAVTDDLARTCSSSASTHGWVAAEDSSLCIPFTVPSSSQNPAPLASIQESKHVADSPSPQPSARSSTTEASEVSDGGRTGFCSRRAGARVRLEDLFDVEAGVECEDPSLVSEPSNNNATCTGGYLNPVAMTSDFDVTLSTLDVMDSEKCESQSLIPSDVSSWKQGCISGTGAGGAYQSPSATSFNTVISEGPICRICHEGEQSGESLISPCRCTGTLKYLHTKCLEQWLQTRNKDNCELCNFDIHTQRRTRPLSEWLRHPSNPRDTRNLGVDVVCGAILSPLVMISAWLCLNGSRHYMHNEERSLEGMGLILLAAVLLAIFLTWSLLTGRYHYMVWREWSKHNQLVSVLTTTKTPTSSRPHSPLVHLVPERLGIHGITFTGIPECNASLTSSNNSHHVDATSM